MECAGSAGALLLHTLMQHKTCLGYAVMIFCNNYMLVNLGNNKAPAEPAHSKSTSGAHFFTASEHRTPRLRKQLSHLLSSFSFKHAQGVGAAQTRASSYYNLLQHCSMFFKEWPFLGLQHCTSFENFSTLTFSCVILVELNDGKGFPAGAMAC